MRIINTEFEKHGNDIDDKNVDHAAGISETRHNIDNKNCHYNTECQKHGHDIDDTNALHDHGISETWKLHC